MVLLERHLAHAPKPYLSRLYRHWFPDEKGVVPNSRIETALNERAFDPSRLEHLFQSMTALQRDLLGAIYGAAGRGTRPEELQLHLPETERFLVADTVEELRRELLIARDPSTGHLFGFSDLWPDLSDLFAVGLSVVPRSGMPLIDLEGFVPHHLLRLFSEILRGEPALTREREPSKRFRQQIEEGLGFAGQISPAALAETTDLLLTLSLAEGWVVRREEQLLLSVEGEEMAERSNRFIRRRLLDAWCRYRRFEPGDLRPLLGLLSSPRFPGEWSRFFTVHDAPRRLDLPFDQPAEWLHLSRPVRELILLGWIATELHTDRGIASLSLPGGAAAWCETGELPEVSEQPGFATPDFEVLLPHTASGKAVWTLHRSARLLSEDRLMKFRIEKEPLLTALRGGLSPSDVRQTADWLRLPEAPSRYIEEWLRSFEMCRFGNHLLLEVRESSLRNQIAATTVAAPWIVEVLEGYGLLLREGADRALMPLLEEFGLHPPPWPPRKQERPSSSFRSAPPPPSTTDHTWTEPPRASNLRLGDLSPAAHHFRSLDEEQRGRVLTYSIRNGKMIQLLLRTTGEGRGKSVKMIPEKVDLGGSPVLFGKEGGGEPVEIPLSEIVNLRIPH